MTDDRYTNALRDALKRNFEGMNGSAVFLDLFDPVMTDREAMLREPIPLLQLGLAILLDKPIILACQPGKEGAIPEHLRRVADAIIVGSPEDYAKGVAAYLDEHGLR